MQESGSDTAEVIFFFAEGKVCKEMMFTEFEAILDGVVGLDDFSGEDMQAAFVVVNNYLMPVSIVLFTIDFDDRGEVPRQWNVPFRDLLEKASWGPDLGQGAIRLAIRSQCPIDWHTDSLWDPEQDTFSEIMYRVKRNRLCLPDYSGKDQQASMNNGYGQYGYPGNDGRHQTHHQTHPPVQSGAYSDGPPMYPRAHPHQPHVSPQVLSPPSHSSQHAPQPNYYAPPATLPQGHNSSAQKKLGCAEEQQQLEISELADSLKAAQGHSEQDFEALMQDVEDKHKIKLTQVLKKQKQYSKKLQEHYQHIVSQHKTALENLKNKKVELSSQLSAVLAQNEALKNQNKDQLQQLEQVIGRIDSRIHQAEEHERQEINKLKLTYSKQIEKKVNKKTNELEIQLEKALKQLSASEETVRNLREELTLLRKDSRRLAGNGTDEFFQKLESSGLSFIAFHPGAGHVSVSILQMAEYLENPIYFAAKKCNMLEEEYRNWLSHFEKPVCLACLAGSSEICSQPVRRIEAPSEFQPGIDDRCSKHRTGYSATANTSMRDNSYGSGLRR